MAAVSNDADGLPVDQFGNNIPLSDDETKSTGLLSIPETEVALISPTKTLGDPNDNIYQNPQQRKKRRKLPALPKKPPSLLVIPKKADPKPTTYFPATLDQLASDTHCIHCKHTICHDLLYGDFCGLQATYFAKSQKKGTCHDLQFKLCFESNYTSSLKYHRYMCVGVIDVTKKYTIPQCMMESSYRNAYAVYKIQKEEAKMARAYVDGLSYTIRKEKYQFDEKGGDDINAA